MSPIAERGRREAWVIVRDDGRFFNGFNKARQPVTSWSLAGAWLFLPSRSPDREEPAELVRVLKRSPRRGWVLRRVEVAS